MAKPKKVSGEREKILAQVGFSLVHTLIISQPSTTLTGPTKCQMTSVLLNEFVVFNLKVVRRHCTPSFTVTLSKPLAKQSRKLEF